LRLVLVAAPLLFLGAFEGVLRSVGAGYPTTFFLPRATAYVSNEKFGWRYFPRAIARTPVPLALDAQKAARRVFVLGESAAMGFPDPAFGLAAYLQSALGSGWEVHNAAMTAINSHAIREIAAECARLNPDVFVIYMGNNEVIGPYGAAAVFGSLTRLPLIRARLWVKSTRLGQLGSRLFTRSDAVPTEWRGLEFFHNQAIPADDPRLERVYAHFETNLRDIIASGRRAGARVLIAPVVVNLRDCPPFLSAAAARAFAAGDYERARDLDELRLRADSRLNAIVVRLASQEGAELVDAALPPTREFFYEHVHLRPEGNRRLAEAFAARLKPGARASLNPTAWDVRRMMREMRALVARPPFTQAHLDAVGELPAADAHQAVRPWQQRLEENPRDLIARERVAELSAELGNYAAAELHYRRLLESLPWRTWHTGLAEALLNQGRFAEAEQSYRDALGLDERFAPAWLGLGVARAAQNNAAEAEQALRRALALSPTLAQAHNSLGRLLESQGRIEEAERCFREAIKAQPDLAVARYNLAGMLARRNRETEAIAELEHAVAAQPDFADAHYDLGLLLARRQQFDDAIRHYALALAANPNHADAANNWGTALARQGKHAEARLRFEQALKLNPGHPAARRNLQLLSRP
jgi:tetratricopeptide (TPR) repeat protein